MSLIHFHSLHYMMAQHPVSRSIKEKTENLYRKCKYCCTHRDVRGFGKHLIACKLRFDIQNEDHTIYGHAEDLVNNNHVNPIAPANVLLETDQQIPNLSPLVDNSNANLNSSRPTFIPQAFVLQSKPSLYPQSSAHILFQLSMVLNFPRNI